MAKDVSLAGRHFDLRPTYFGLFTAAALFLSSICAPMLCAQEQSPETARSDGLLGDNFARDNGAIIVTAKRLGGNLFEAVETPEDSCLANAPRLGVSEPGFAIDATGLTKVRQLERIRRKTRAGTIYISGGKFVGADFRRAALYNMCFFGTDLSQSNWTGLSAPGLGFVDVDLTAAQMTNARLPDVLFRDTNLSLVNARGASWAQGRLDGGWGGSLRGLDLTNADLTDFRFVCGNSAEDGCPTERSGISMAGANLRRASLHSFFTADLALANARIDQSELSLDHLDLLGEAQLVGPIVLRSARRAVMLFPTEAAQLAEVAQGAEASLNVCLEPAAKGDAAVAINADNTASPVAAPPSRAVGMICDLPGSEPRGLLQSVALLESAAQGLPGFQDRRLAWAAGRDACVEFTSSEEVVACILSAYRSRQRDLRVALGTPEWLTAPGYRLFLSREAAFPTDPGRPGLYGRILPVLLDSAVAAVIVRADGEGGAQAKGVALDGCYFEAEALGYDIEQAQLGFMAEPPPPPRPNRRSRRSRRSATSTASPVMEAPLLAISGRDALVLDGGLARTQGGCVASNPFPRLEEVQLNSSLLETIWERF